MAATTIQDVRARRIFDGCARPSLEVVVTTEAACVCAAPSYSDPRSSGKYEITHFPDGGVQGSIDLINSTIRDRLIGMDSTNQQEIDDLFLQIDGSNRFDNIGGNTAEATSMAVAKAAAASLRIPLYRHIHGDGVIGVPHQMPNIIGGGATMGNAGWKGRSPDIQDHVILPVGCQSTYQEMECVSAVFHRVGLLLQDADPAYTGGRDEEYCWLPGLDDVTCLDVLKQACDEVAESRDISFRLGLDVGAADLWDEEAQVYIYAREGIQRTPAEHARHLADLVDRFKLFYMEDSFFEDHVDLYVEQMQQYGKHVLVAGDDLLAGDLHRLDEHVYTGGRDEEYCWLPGLDDVTCLDVLKQACDEVAESRDISFRLGLDVGAADLWDEEAQVYIYAREGIQRTPAEHARHLADLVDRFKLFYMEDSFFEDHVDLYVEQMQQYGKHVLVAGDDLLAGDLHRLDEMAERGAVNAAVIKLNMAGTVTRTGQFVKTCKAYGFATIGSCRTYDSPDDTLADLIVGWGCNAYKCGSPAGGEHAAKYNRYIRIDEELGTAPTLVNFSEVQP